MQKRVLLAAVEAVDLVDEQDGAQPEPRQALFGRVDLTPQVGHRAADSRHLHERGFRAFGDDVRERGLPRARRTEQDDRAQPVLLDGGAQPATGADRLLLADDLLERARTHPHGERRHLRLPLVLHVCEQRIHERYGIMRTLVCLYGVCGNHSMVSETIPESRRDSLAKGHAKESRCRPTCDGETDGYGIRSLSRTRSPASEKDQYDHAQNRERKAHESRQGDYDHPPSVSFFVRSPHVLAHLLHFL